MKLMGIEYFRDYFFPISLGGSLAILAFVWLSLGADTAIKGGYVLIGLLFAAGYYYKFPSSDKSNSIHDSIRPRTLSKIVIILSMTSLILSGFLGFRLPVVLVLAPIGFGLIGLQIIQDSHVKEVIPQICLVFFSLVASKYLTTGFYFGSGDILLDVPRTTGLLQHGHISGIPGGYSRFPGKFILTGTLSSVSGISVYDGILVTGIIIYSTAVLLITYTIVREKFSERVGVSSVLLFAVLEQVLFRATYVSAQAVGFVIALLIFYIAIRKKNYNQSQFTQLAIIMTIALVFTHHATLLLFLPIFGVFILVNNIVTNLRLPSIANASNVEASWGIWTICFTAAVGYWALVSQQTVKLLFWGTADLAVSSLKIGSSLQEAGPVTLGVQLANPHPIQSLASFPGLYYSLLVFFFSLGLAIVAKKPKKFIKGLDILIVGFLGSVFFFKTPFQIAAQDRLRLFVGVFSGVITGIGSFHVLSGKKRSQIFIAFVLITLMSAAGSVVAADDIRTPGEGQSSPREFSSQEFSELQSVSSFSSNYNVQFTSFWLERFTVHPINQELVNKPRVRSDDIVISEGHFLYRTSWENETILYRSDLGGFRSIFMSGKWIEKSVDGTNKVYTTGGTGLVWSESEYTFRPKSSTNNIG